MIPFDCAMHCVEIYFGVRYYLLTMAILKLMNANTFAMKTSVHIINIISDKKTILEWHQLFAIFFKFLIYKPSPRFNDKAGNIIHHPPVF